MNNFYKEFNLNKKEVSVFEELLRLGSTSASILARRLGLPRSTVYVHLDKLIKVGLVTQDLYKGVSRFEAVDSSTIRGLLKRKINRVEESISDFEAYIPRINELRVTASITPKIKFYQGEERVGDVYEEVLKQDGFKAFFNPQRVKEKMPQYYNLIPDNVKKNKKFAMELLVNCQEAIEYHDLYNSRKHKIKILPKGISFSSDVIFTDNKIFMIGYSDDEIVATEIWNNELAQTQAGIFDLLWFSIK